MPVCACLSLGPVLLLRQAFLEDHRAWRRVGQASYRHRDAPDCSPPWSLHPGATHHHPCSAASLHLGLWPPLELISDLEW